MMQFSPVFRQAHNNLGHYRESSREQRIVEQEKFEQEKIIFQQTIAKLNKRFLSKQDKLGLEQKLANQNKYYVDLLHEKDVLNNLIEKLQQNLKEIEIVKILCKNNILNLNKISFCMIKQGSKVNSCNSKLKTKNV